MPNQFELTCFEGDPPFVCVCVGKRLRSA